VEADWNVTSLGAFWALLIDAPIHRHPVQGPAWLRLSGSAINHIGDSGALASIKREIPSS